MRFLDTPVPWCAVFGNDRPVEVEIGPGRGETLLAFAAARPAVNFFGIERSAGAAERLVAQARSRGLANLRVVASAAELAVLGIADATVAAYHIYFPDPWPKTAHRERRLARGSLTRELARTLRPGGVVHVATDLPGVLAELGKALEAAGLERRPGGAAPSRPTTSFERRYAAAGTHYARFVRRAR